MLDNNSLHIPVLLDQTVEFLNPQKNESYLDLTAGYGGHAAAIISKTGSEDGATLVDRDSFAIKQLQDKFPKSDIVHSDFAKTVELLVSEGKQFDLILADLGVSSVQFDFAERGFGFRNDSRLDMRMDTNQELTAEFVLNKYPKSKIMDILREYGDEPRAAFIASLIVENRPLSTTGELEKLCKRAYPGYTKKNPATRTFQAIRIEVNNEINQLKKTLDYIPKLLKPTGRVAIISFHSLEDGIVKRFFKGSSSKYDGLFKNLKMLKSSATIDSVRNIRSRSAILRSAERTEN